MARGFESKSVADQQEQAERVHDRPAREVIDPLVAAKRRRLELSLADVQHKLEGALAAGHREMLRRAQAALEKELAGLR